MIAQTTLDASVNWLAKYEAQYSEAEARGDAIGMAKALDGTLRTKIAISEGDERQRLVAARCNLVMKIPEAAPSRRAMVKAIVTTERNKTTFDADRDHPEREYRPRPTSEQAQRDRDFAVSMSLVRARQRLAKCVAARDHLGAINAMECQLTCEQSLAKSEDSRQHIRQLRGQLCSVASEAGFIRSPQGVYGLPKASSAQVQTAKQFDAMYQNLTQALDRATGANMRQEIETLRSEVVAMAQGMGCRLRNGHFVPYAS